jgi:UDP-N-acetylmuramate: L-alanyl-gamma-D-glutamyl-meso-diaminopimelate ligase
VVTCSGVGIIEPEKEKLAAAGLLPDSEGWNPDVLTKDYDYVIPANDLSLDNPELVRAKELNLLVLSFPEYIFHRFKNKSRMLICEPEAHDSIREIVYFALKRNNVAFDYVFAKGIQGDPALSWSYDARIALLEEDRTFSPFIKKQINEYYRPHIFVLAQVVKDRPDMTDEEYKASMKRMLSSIERDGKFIYLQREPLLCELAEMVREDVTAMPIGEHATRTDADGQTYLVSRFGDFRIGRHTPEFLTNLNAARIACRQLGLQDKDFYEAVSHF